MLEDVVEVAGITGISQTAARILLNHYKWDREQLLERIYSADDNLEQLVPSVSEGQFWRPSLHSDSTAECEICYEDQRREMLGLSCGHQFCTECWVEHINTRISHHQGTAMIECPASCKVILDDETVLSVLPERARAVFSTLIGRELHSVAMQALLCHKVLYGIRDRWLPCTERSYLL